MNEANPFERYGPLFELMFPRDHEALKAAAADPDLGRKAAEASALCANLTTRLGRVWAMRSPYQKPFRKQRPGRRTWIARKTRLIARLEAQVRAQEGVSGLLSLAVFFSRIK